jgi:hypothetical protein
MFFEAEHQDKNKNNEENTIKNYTSFMLKKLRIRE